MSTRPPRSTDRDQLAAEYALGVLAGDEEERARELECTDADFRDLVALWRGRLAPLMEEVSAVSAPLSLWARIEQRLGKSANDNDASIRRRLTMWQGVAGAMTALAAVLAIVLVQQPRSVPAPVIVEIASTYTPGATVRTDATSALGFSTRSHFVNTTSGVAPLSQASVR